MVVLHVVILGKEVCARGWMPSKPRVKRTIGLGTSPALLLSFATLVASEGATYDNAILSIFSVPLYHGERIPLGSILRSLL